MTRIKALFYLGSCCLLVAACSSKAEEARTETCANLLDQYRIEITDQFGAGSAWEQETRFRATFAKNHITGSTRVPTEDPSGAMETTEVENQGRKRCLEEQNANADFKKSREEYLNQVNLGLY